MRLVMDRLLEVRTELDREIREQLRVAATCGAMRDLDRLERAREHVRQAAMILVPLDNEPGTAGRVLGLDASSSTQRP